MSQKGIITMPTFHEKPKKRSRFLKASLIIVSFFAALAAVMAAMFFFFMVTPPDIPDRSTLASGDEAELSLTTLTQTTAPARFDEANRKELFYTVLIIGLTEGFNANTIMVASFDGVSGDAALVSIPRDSLVNVNRWHRKIHAAFPIGMQDERGFEGGVAQMQREVMSVIGFVPDFYVVIDYAAFEQIIDAVGGIEIEAPFHMRYDDPCQDLHINILPGLQQMDGRTALHFARYRQSNFGYQDITDYQRIEHQQMVVAAVMNNLFRPANVLRIPTFVDIFTENVHTNLSAGNLLWFAMQFQEVRGTDALSTYTLPAETSGYPRWYEILYAPGIVELVNRTINPYEQEIELRDLDIITY